VSGLAVDGAFDRYRRVAGWRIRTTRRWCCSRVGALGADERRARSDDYIGRIAPRPV